MIVDDLLKYSLFYQKDGEQMLSKYFSRSNALMAAFDIISRADKPITTEELISRAARDYPQFEPRNITNRLHDLDGIFPFAHGLWGALHHLPFSEPEIINIKELSIEFLASCVERVEQFHSRELLEYLSTKNPDLENKTNDFQIAGLLRSFNICPYLGRNVFSHDGISVKLSIHEVIVGYYKKQ